MIPSKISQFVNHVRFGYLFFTALVIIGIVFGLFELVEYIFFQNVSLNATRWLYISRGIFSSLLLFIWTAWTIFSYRSMYQKRLQTTESRYKDIIENSADAILFLSLKDIITTWNKGAENIFGWEKGNIVGKSILRLIPEHIDAQSELNLINTRLQENGNISNFETERKTLSGRNIPIVLTQTIIKNEQGGKVGSSLIMRDITRMKLRTESMRHSERLATLGHMAAGVAHEVGNPLSAISSLVQLTQRKTEDEFVQANLQKIREQIRRINTIMRDLADFARPSTGEITSVKLNSIIHEAAGLLKHDVRFRHVKFVMNLEEELPSIDANGQHIHQVIVNLLLNAVDAMQKIVEPEIKIVSYSDSRSVYIRVEDNGYGISKEIQGKIFEPFFTTKPVGSGTGLGLSVSHGIIAKMGGRITVKSEINAGAVFTIKLPFSPKVS